MDQTLSVNTDQAYLSKNFNEIQSQKRFLPSGTSENLEDFRHYFTSSDESFTSNSSSNSDKSYQKKNDVLKTCDLLLNDDDKRSNWVNYNDVDNNEHSSSKEHHKSLKSLVQYVKKLSLKSEKSTEDQHQNRSILRRPTEYIFVKGMSGLPIRVPKASPSSNDHQLYVSKDWRCN